MDAQSKLIGRFAVFLAMVGILGALRDCGAMLFTGLGDTAPRLRIFGISLIILPLFFAIVLTIHYKWKAREART